MPVLKEDDDTKSSGLGNLVERRVYQDMELRVDEDTGGITGYAAVFNKWSEDLGYFKEKIQEGAFTKTISENDDVRALINHDPNLIIGRTKNKTLKLWEDERGLVYDVQLPDTSYANDLRESIKRKDITQNSFGFQVIQDEWSKDVSKRTLTEVKLFDVSPVAFPAYKQTSVALRHQTGMEFQELCAALVRADRGIADKSDEEILDRIAEIATRHKLIVEEPLDEHSETILEPDCTTPFRARLATMAIRRNIYGGK